MVLEPLNTEWNRKTGMLPGKGNAQLLGIKHGLAYFIWKDMEGNLAYLQCDEHVMKKHFGFTGMSTQDLDKLTSENLAPLLLRKTKFLKYPFEVT